MLKRNLLAVLSIALIVFLTACEKPHDSGTNYKSKFVDGVLVEGERGKLGQAFESSMSFFSTKDKKRPFDGENLIVETPSENMLNSRGRFGVIIGADITPAIKEALNLGSSDGALVSDVEENSPAEKIGLKAGDVIISFNGVAIKEATDLPNAVGLMEIGNIYNITYLRKERKIENKIEIEAYSSPGFEQGVTLVEREGLLYIKFSSNPYTGSFSVYYENGKVSKTINVRDGLFDGPFIEYHENGQLVLFKSED